MLTTPECLRCVVRKEKKKPRPGSVCVVLLWCCELWLSRMSLCLSCETCFTVFVMHEHEEPGVYIDWLSLVYSTLVLKLWEHFIHHNFTHSHIFIQAHFICLSAFNQTFTLQWMQLWVHCLPHAACSSQGSNLSNWTTVIPGTPGALVS